MEDSCATYNNYRKSSKDQICCSDATDVPCRSVCLADVVEAVAVHVRLRRQCMFMPESCLEGLRQQGSGTCTTANQRSAFPPPDPLSDSSLGCFVFIFSSSFTILLLPFQLALRCLHRFHLLFFFYVVRSLLSLPLLSLNISLGLLLYSPPSPSSPGPWLPLSAPSYPVYFSLAYYFFGFILFFSLPFFSCFCPVLNLCDLLWQ